MTQGSFYNAPDVKDPIQGFDVKITFPGASFSVWKFEYWPHQKKVKIHIGLTDDILEFVSTPAFTEAIKSFSIETWDSLFEAKVDPFKNSVESYIPIAAGREVVPLQLTYTNVSLVRKPKPKA